MLFKKWVLAMGFHGKAVTKAGESIGMGQTAARERWRGDKTPDMMERLAMSAAAAGLPPWTPNAHDDLVRYRKVVELITGRQRHEGRE